VEQQILWISRVAKFSQPGNDGASIIRPWSSLLHPDRALRRSGAGAGELLVAPRPLELSFSPPEIGSLFMAVLIGALVAGTDDRTGTRASSSLPSS